MEPAYELYGEADRLTAFRAAFERAGKRPDDLPTGLIGEAVAAITPAAYIAAYERIKPPSPGPAPQ